MTEEYRERLADFVSKYVDLKDNRFGYGHDKVIRQAVKMLIDEGIFTKESLIKAAAKQCGVIIPGEFIDECIK